MTKYVIFSNNTILSYSRVTAIGSWIGKLEEGDMITVNTKKNSDADYSTSYLEIELTGVF